MLGGWDGDALPKVKFQDILSDSCRSHAALLATMAPEGNLDALFLPHTLVIQGKPHLFENIGKHPPDETPGDGGASSLAKYRGRVI